MTPDSLISAEKQTSGIGHHRAVTARLPQRLLVRFESDMQEKLGFFFFLATGRGGGVEQGSRKGSPKDRSGGLAVYILLNIKACEMLVSVWRPCVATGQNRNQRETRK